MRKITYLLMVLFLSSSVLFAQNMTQEESDFLKMKLAQKEAALGPITYETGDKGADAVGDDCTDPFIYGNINDPSLSGSIISNGEKWYSFTGPDDLIVTVSLCASAFDTKLEVWNDCADGVYAYYNDDACNFQSEISEIPFVGGNTMYVKVFGYSTESGDYTLEITGVLPPPDPDPITLFPFEEDFESGVFSAKTVPHLKTQSDITIEPFAANSSSFGAMFQGGSSNWGVTPGDVDAAFAYAEHVSKLKMLVVPDGDTMELILEFDLVQRYSFKASYEWFRVLVDGVPIPDADGNYFHQATSNTADAWKSLHYNLTAYKDLASFNLTLENAAKYRYQYYHDGDIALIDNINLFYTPPPPIPLSNWAFVLFGLFFLTFVFIKFRR